MSELPVRVRWTAPIECPCYLWDPPLIQGDEAPQEYDQTRLRVAACP